MTAKINLAEALATFGDIYSPRIVGRVNDYDVKVAHVSGEHVWHAHERTDEFFLVIDGRFDVTLREPGGPERTVELRAVTSSWSPGACSTSRPRRAAPS